MHTPQVLHNAYGGGGNNIMIIAVISLVPYLTDKGELTALYKIDKNVYIKPPQK